jgi:hypothetical protein
MALDSFYKTTPITDERDIKIFLTFPSESQTLFAVDCSRPGGGFCQNGRAGGMMVVDKHDLTGCSAVHMAVVNC